MRRLLTLQLVIYAACVVVGIGIGYLLASRPDPGPDPIFGTHYVDRHHPQCADTAEGGSEERPYCTVRFAATTDRAPGNTIVVRAGKYGEGPFTFTRDGTEAAPITWKADGKVTLGHFAVFDAAAFAPVAGQPQLYAIPYEIPEGKSVVGVFQTHYDPITVDDDSNNVVFTMVDSDGPLKLKSVTSDGDLNHEGTYRYANGAYVVHPYTNRAPAKAGLVVAFDDSLDVDASWNIFEDFTISYTSGYNALTQTGEDNRYRRLRFEAVPLYVRGDRLRTEDVRISHVIYQGENFNFYHAGDGTGLIVDGWSHVFRRTTILHTWNASVQLERASGTTVDGVIMHGSPNHCGVGTVAATGTDNMIRNVVAWNCQDFTYWATSEDDAIGAMTIEHLTVPGGLFFETRDNAPVTGPITVRNSIFNGAIGFGYKSSAYNPAMCQYEKAMVVEHSVLVSDMEVFRCSTGKKESITGYMEKCSNGTYTDCITFRNNQLVAAADWGKVVTGGNWFWEYGDSWNAVPPAGSPAIGLAKPGATTDVTGATRPQGTGPDAGAYEVK